MQELYEQIFEESLVGFWTRSVLTVHTKVQNPNEI